MVGLDVHFPLAGTRGRVPQVDPTVVAHGGDTVVDRAEQHRNQPAGGPSKLPELLTGAGLPQPHDAVVADGGELLAGPAEPDLGDRARSTHRIQARGRVSSSVPAFT